MRVTIASVAGSPTAAVAATIRQVSTSSAVGPTPPDVRATRAPTATSPPEANRKTHGTGFGGAAYLSLSKPIAAVVALLLIVVVASYRQTVYAYPSGGGAFVVSLDNLGQTPALGAAAALLVDYVMTVAVSVVAGVVAITS